MPSLRRRSGAEPRKGNDRVGHRILCSMARPLSSRETDVVCWRIAQSLLPSLDEVSHREVAPLIAAQDWVSLCKLEPDYSRLGPLEAQAYRQIQSLFSKRRDLTAPGVDKEAVAIEKFIDSERICSVTDEVFRREASGAFFMLPDVGAVFHYAIRKIASILGPCPSLEDLHGRFGPGSTTDTSKKNAHPLVKLAGRLACSGATLTSLGDELSAFRHDLGDFADVAVQPGKVSFVEKDWKSHRNVVAEAPLTGFFQLGIGDFLADRLRSFGIDISDQTRNKTLAKIGSITGALATLDLKMASDTIALSLVERLVPPDWFDLFSRFRTTDVDLDGRPYRLRKIASTGNGFTFPLETMIFYALAWGAAKHLDEDCGIVSVYGDDIIVPTRCVSLTLSTLSAAGFIVNMEKSFWTGPFRESCGGDFLLGFDIRPAYVRDTMDFMSMYTLHNALRANGLRRQAAIVRRFISPDSRLYGPEGYGDGHLHGDVKLTPFKRDVGYGGWTFDTIVRSPKRRKIRVDPQSAYIYALYSTYARDADQTANHELGQEPDREDRRALRAVRERKAYDCWPDTPRGDSQLADGSFWLTFPSEKRGCEFHRVRIYTLNPT